MVKNQRARPTTPYSPTCDGSLPRLDGQKTMESFPMAFGFQLMLRVMFGIYMHRRSLTWSKVTTVGRGSAALRLGPLTLRRR